MLTLLLACTEPPQALPNPVQAEAPVVASLGEGGSIKPEGTLSGSAPSQPEEPVLPTFTSSVRPLSAETRAAMLETGVWKEGCPVPLDGLSELHLAHHSLGGVQEGVLIAASVQAEGLVQVFGTLFENGVVIEKMRPAHEYGGDDHKMMADNTTSAFNCRPVEGGAKYSEHSYGHAVDFNPLWNPYVRGEKVQPPGGKDYLDRTVEKSGLVRDGDVVVQAFGAIGWKWGGYWTRSKDYQHFSATGK